MEVNMMGKKGDHQYPRGKFLLIACASIFLVFQISLSPNSTLQANPSTSKTVNFSTGKKMRPTSKRNLLPPEGLQLRMGDVIHCDRTHNLYDLCSVNGPTALDPTSSTFYVMGPSINSSLPFLVEKVKPYPRKFEGYVMSKIQEITIVSGRPSPRCQVQHSAPALVFSAGGYTGNFFHEFNEGFVPLFVTSNTVFPNRDFVIVASEAPDWWLERYADLLRVFSKHPIINLQNDTATHCFPSATIGLITHDSMTIDRHLLPNSKTLIHFRGLLNKAFRQNFTFYFNQNRAFPKPRRPRLLFAGRTGDIGRVIINQDEVIKMMKGIGFEVIVFEPSDTSWLCESYALVNSSHAMVGVHGAALTHSLFLRPGSVFVQVVPLGVDWAADVCFGRVARGLNLEYLEYKIGAEESTLIEIYGKNNKLLKHARTLQEGWPAQIMDIYLRKQNVKIDLVRFRAFMQKAYVKARKFMRKSRLRKIDFHKH